jgi:hypothetical protein
MADISTISRRSGGGERSSDARDAGSDWEHCGSPWQAQFNDLERRDLLHAGRSGYRCGRIALNLSLQAVAETPSRRRPDDIGPRPCRRSHGKPADWKRATGSTLLASKDNRVRAGVRHRANDQRRTTTSGRKSNSTHIVTRCDVVSGRLAARMTVAREVVRVRPSGGEPGLRSELKH